MPIEWHPPPSVVPRFSTRQPAPLTFTGEARMTPWGLHGLYKRGEKKVWRPRVGGHDALIRGADNCRKDVTGPGIKGQVRGRWLRDWHKLNHNHQSMSDTEPHPRYDEKSIGGYSAVLSAYPPGHGHILCDPDWDMAETAGGGAASRHPTVSSPQAPQKPSHYRLEKLPVQVLKMIVAYLVPVGCAYSFITLDYLLYPSADGADLAGARFCSLVQQMVPLWPIEELSPWSSNRAAPVVRGSAHLALANTNRFFQELVYERFFGGNTFIFHQATSPFLFNWIRSKDFDCWQSWSRILAHSGPNDVPGKAPFGLLGPLGSRAARYLRNVHLIIASPPTEVGDAEAMTKLADMVDSTITLLLPSKEDEAEEKEGQKLALSVHIHCSHPSPEYRDPGKSHPTRRCHQLPVLQADVNPSSGMMEVGLRKDFTRLRKISWPSMPSSKLDKVLKPLRRLSGRVGRLSATGVEITPSWLEEMGLRVDKNSARKDLNVPLERSEFKVLTATAK